MQILKILISIFFIIVFKVYVFSQNITNIENVTIEEILTIEKSSLKAIKLEKSNYIEKNANSFSFADCSFDTTDINKNNTYFKLFFERNKIKRIQYFDGKYPDKSFVYMLKVNEVANLKILHLYTDFKNYRGFIVSNKRTGLNLFFGYNHHYLHFMNPIENINRIFLLDSNFNVDKELMFNKKELKYKTVPVMCGAIYKYEKSYSHNNERLTKNTTIKDVFEMMNVNNSLDYKILYMFFTEEEKSQHRTRIYPIWSCVAPLYFLCNNLKVDKNDNMLYFKQVRFNDTIINMLIDEKIRGELECFEWFY